MPLRLLDPPPSLRFIGERTGFRIQDALPSAALAAAAAIFEAASLVLLVPATQAAIALDFGLVRRSSFAPPLLRSLPILEEHSDKGLYLLLLAGMFSCVLLKLGLSYFAAVTFARKVHNMAGRLRQALFDRTLGFGKLYLDQSNSGHIQHVIIASSDRIAANLIALHEIFAGMFMLGAYVFLMLAISLPLTLAFALLLPIIHRSGGRLTARIKESSKALSAAREALSSHTANVLGGILLVKSYASEEWERSRFAGLNRAVEGHAADMDIGGNLMRPIQEAAFLLMMGLFLSALAFVSNDRNSSMVPGLLVFVYLARRASISIMLLGRLNAIAATVEGSVAEASRLLDDSGKHLVPDGPWEFGPLRSEIRFENVRYAFPGGPDVLKGVSFSARRGKMTALVGQSGAGKTTLFNLLMRFYDPPPGSVLLDGSDVRQFSLSSVAAHVAMVGQETLLLNDTIRNNLVYAMEKPPPDQDLLSALEQSCLLEFVLSQPKGLDTVIGDRGVKLSGGEKQRLSITRAMLKDAEILLFDEATSSLDSGTEALLQRSIESLLRGRTSLVVAHRLSTIRNADWVIVLEDGVVAEEGPLARLLATDGPFRRHWEAQGFLR